MNNARKIKLGKRTYTSLDNAENAKNITDNFILLEKYNHNAIIKNESAAASGKALNNVICVPTLSDQNKIKNEFPPNFANNFPPK